MSEQDETSKDVAKLKDLEKRVQEFGQGLIDIEEDDPRGYVIYVNPMPADAESIYENLAILFKSLSTRNIRYSVRVNPARWRPS